MDNVSYLSPAFSNTAVPIVFAANNDFIPVFSVCFRSLLNHVNKKDLYDVVLVHTAVDQSYCDILKKMCESFPNVSLRFYNAKNIIEQYGLSAGGHITAETYYRFLIQDILPDYNKVLYLDCDTILCADPAELYKLDLQGKLLAAARDPEFLGRINGANYATIEYCKKFFPMKDPYQYFQAGVLILNTQIMRKIYSTKQWLMFAQQPFKYHDQDVLNLYCEGQVLYLDMAWNLLTDCDHTRISNIINYAPSEIKEEYYHARKSPKIIHYAGFMKPWNNPKEDFAQEFWQIARDTPFYEILLYQMMQFNAKKEFSQKNRLSKKTLTKAFGGILPQGSKRRELCKKLLAKNQWLCNKLHIMQ